MIRYEVDRAEIEARVTALDANWLDRARNRTEGFIDLGRFEEASSIWSTVKPVFMILQQNKCVFCERQFESVDYGKIEFDLEHFRPKSSIEPWPHPKRHAFAYDFPTGGAQDIGYYWLAYDLENYAASCKVCNSNLKANYFPVAANRGAVPAGVAALLAEEPFLCYPIGSLDEDPEDLVTFIATTAVPAASEGHRKRRGQVIIDFFALNDRENLHRERARMISLLGGSLRAISNDDADEADTEIVEELRTARFPHTACLRAFHDLWHQDEPLARRVLAACKAYSVSEAGTPAPVIDP
jgi:hypothetical protein